jgi:hypothetical protein
MVLAMRIAEYAGRAIVHRDPAEVANQIGHVPHRHHVLEGLRGRARTALQHDDGIGDLALMAGPVAELTAHQVQVGAIDPHIDATVGEVLVEEAFIAAPACRLPEQRGVDLLGQADQGDGALADGGITDGGARQALGGHLQTADQRQASHEGTKDGRACVHGRTSRRW